MDLTEIFKALANCKRLEILMLLKAPEKNFDCEIKNGGVCLKAIEEKINLSQSTVSHYINILHKAKLINLERIGQWTYCKINRQTILMLQQAIADLASFK